MIDNRSFLRFSPLVLPFVLAGLSCDSDDSGGDGGSGGTRAVGGASSVGGSVGTTGLGGSLGVGGSGGSLGSGGSGGFGGSGGMAGSAGDGGAAGAAGAPGDRDVFRPELRDFDEAYLDELSLPDGFTIEVYATNLKHARMLAVHGDHVYLTRPQQGDVLRLVDADEDGVAESQVSVVTDLKQVHGIAFSGTNIFLATDKQVYRGDVNDAGNVVDLEPVGQELPDGGQHPLRTLGIGPDDMLYISVGSNCDACEQNDPELAAMLRANGDGTQRTVFASGLRNTIGFGWHPDTGQLWGMDHGSDWRGNDLPPEELNRIQSGKDYGWPYCFAKREVDPIIDDPVGTTKEAYCADTAPSVAEYQAHGAPIGMVFYDSDGFPEEYEGDAFIAMHGSWNRFPPTGYEIVRLRFDDGTPVGFESFVSGFLIEDGEAIFGRPAGIAVAPDGTLLFSDDANGVVYRVSHDGS